MSQFPDFVLRAELRFGTRVRRQQFFGATSQRLDGLADDPPHEIQLNMATSAWPQPCTQTCGCCPSASCVSAFAKRKIGVEYAQHLLVRRMRVTFGVGARGLIFDGSDDSQHAMATGTAVDAETVRPVQFARGCDCGWQP